MSKIAADLLDVLQRRERARGSRCAVVQRRPIEVCILFDWPVDALVARGFPISGHVSHVAQGGELSPDQIRQVADRQAVSIALPPTVSVMLDRSVLDLLGKDAWAEGKGKGEGVVVGVVHSGFDVFHGAFRNRDDSSRILRLWDQAFNYAAGVPVDSTDAPITGDMQPKDETGAVLTPARADRPAGAGRRQPAAAVHQWRGLRRGADQRRAHRVSRRQESPGLSSRCARSWLPGSATSPHAD